MQVKTVVRAAVLASALMAAAANAGKVDCAMDPLPADAYVPVAATPAPTTAVASGDAAATPVLTAAPVATEPAVVEAVVDTEAPAADYDDVDDSGDDDDAADGEDEVDGDADDSTVATETSAPAASTSGQQQTSTGTVSTSFSYTGVNCGGAGGVYEMVTDIGSCGKTAVTTSSPVSPFDDDVSLSFRGPMNIHNIAVFDGSSGSSWSRVSSYTNGGAAENMVFLNNHNIDYTGSSSPEGFALADGTGTAQQSTPFGGSLAAATDPYGSSIYAEDKTGAEVHIMTETPCGNGAECKGAYDSDGTAFQGWTGTKKLFITKVDMPNGGAPNVPAIWMLNAQSMRSGQYQCNCRGVGPAGGCGELDIAEVLEKDTSMIATHYYFYDGTYNPGNDRLCARPTDAPATYVTIIDEAYGVKVLELGGDDFDFSSTSISNEVVAAWESA